MAALPLFLVSGCDRKPRARIRLATTTSVEESGLLDVLLPPFEERHGIKVDVIAVGTGKAIKHGENGDVDVILVHAREAEDKFVADGFGVDRRDVMYNDFVILGPPSDPAGVRGMNDAAAALTKISRSGSLFISRGDDSGTHMKEKALWRDAGVEPSGAGPHFRSCDLTAGAGPHFRSCDLTAGAWYLAAGQGMSAVLVMAHEKQAYTLSDRGTYLALADKVSLEVLVEGDPGLVNPYGVIAVNPEKHPHVKHAGAVKFVAWLTSPEARGMIAGFKRGGRQLFYPGAARE